MNFPKRFSSLPQQYTIDFFIIQTRTIDKSGQSLMNKPFSIFTATHYQHFLGKEPPFCFILQFQCKAIPLTQPHTPTQHSLKAHLLPSCSCCPYHWVTDKLYHGKLSFYHIEFNSGAISLEVNIAHTLLKHAFCRVEFLYCTSNWLHLRALDLLKIPHLKCTVRCYFSKISYSTL